MRKLDYLIGLLVILGLVYICWSVITAKDSEPDTMDYEASVADWQVERAKAFSGVYGTEKLK